MENLAFKSFFGHGVFVLKFDSRGGTSAAHPAQATRSDFLDESPPGVHGLMQSQKNATITGTTQGGFRLMRLLRMHQTDGYVSQPVEDCIKRPG